MKTIILGAAGLLLSGTALAGVATNKGISSATTAVPVAAKDADGLGGSMIGNAITIDWPSKAIETGRAFDAKRVADAAKASAQTEPEAATAEAPSTSEMSAAVVATEDYDGVGGPDEDAVATAAAPATSYAACSPGPGDDNCIQLYEPGVTDSYAAWQANSGMPGTEQTAMGGPDEDVESAAGSAAASYPPCRSRSDDRCIQAGEHETLASVESGERLAMGGPDDELEVAAYEPLPEDAVMPASAEVVEKDEPDTMAL